MSDGVSDKIGLPEGEPTFPRRNSKDSRVRCIHFSISMGLTDRGSKRGVGDLIVIILHWEVF